MGLKIKSYSQIMMHLLRLLSVVVLVGSLSAQLLYKGVLYLSLYNDIYCVHCVLGV